MGKFESDSELNPMVVSELDWLLDGMATAVGRFDANGDLVLHNAALACIWPWMHDLAPNLPYANVLAELTARHPEAIAEWQYIQAWMHNPQVTVSLQVTLQDKTRQEWRMRPATAGGFWCLIQCLDVEDAGGSDDGPLADVSYERQARAAQEVVTTLNQTQELSALKARIITMISHEFRTPLTQIQSAVELLRYLDLGEIEQAEVFEQVYQGIRTITTRMDDVLQVRRQWNEPVPVSPPMPVNVVTLCQMTLDRMSRESDRPIQLKSQLTPEEQCLALDREMVQQMLRHLLSNAIKYSTAEAPIWVELERVGDRLLLRVCDRGMGILAEDIPYLFDYFYRGKNIGSIPGTGLGLSILNYYLQLLAGEIEVKSQPGEGSCFTLSLPIVL